MPLLSPEKPRSQKLSIHLIKEGVVEDARIIKADQMGNRMEIEANDVSVGTLYVKGSVGRPPKWAAFLSPTVLDAFPYLFNQSTASVLIVRRGTRIFALTFGFGHSMLLPGVTEERFGLIVTLNSISGDIKSMDVQSFDTISSHKRTQASRSGSFADFGLDIERDLLRSAVGVPDDTSLGTRMCGGDTLQVNVPLHPGDIPAQLDRYLVKFEEQGYKTRFPWIDQLAEIKDPGKIADLNVQLASRIASQNADKIWLAVPEIIDWKDVDGFRYEGESRDVRHPDLHVTDFLNSLKADTTITPELIKENTVSAIGATHDMEMQTWSIYQCIYCEIETEEGISLLSGGKWYRVAQDFVDAVNEDASEIEIKDDLLPNYRDKNEGAYNERIASENADFSLMDKNLVYAGNPSGIEFCDLFSATKQIVHVKRYGASTVLSHLFSQGGVSGTLLMNDARFRAELIAKLPASHSSLVTQAKPDAGTFEVVFAIVSKSRKDIISSLPFFSRINLRSAAQMLKGYGYKVSITKIGIDT